MEAAGCCAHDVSVFRFLKFTKLYLISQKINYHEIFIFIFLIRSNMIVANTTHIIFWRFIDKAWVTLLVYLYFVTPVSTRLVEYISSIFLVFLLSGLYLFFIFLFFNFFPNILLYVCRPW